MPEPVKPVPAVPAAPVNYARLDSFVIAFVAASVEKYGLKMSASAISDAILLAKNTIAQLERQ